MTQPRTILLAGLAEKKWTEFTPAEFDALNAAVRSGSRLVIALRAKNVPQNDTENSESSDRWPRVKAGKAKEKSVPKKTSDEPKQENSEPEPEPALRRRSSMPIWPNAGARRSCSVAARLGVAILSGAVLAAHPDERRCRGGGRLAQRFLFQDGAGWDVAGVVPARRRTGAGGAITGAGHLVLAADVYFLSNEALQEDRSTPLLVWLIGPHTRVLFDESHLGVVADPGIAALARRYGMSGAFFTLLLLAALFVWRRMALFVPPPDDAPEIALLYHPAAGLRGAAAPSPCRKTNWWRWAWPNGSAPPAPTRRNASRALWPRRPRRLPPSNVTTSSPAHCAAVNPKILSP